MSAPGKPGRDLGPTGDGLLDIYRELAAAPDRPALRAAVLGAARTFGFTAVYYLVQVTRDPSVGRVLLTQGVPEMWERQYRRRLRLIDPLPDYAMDIMHIFRWGSVLDSIPLSRAQERYQRLLQHVGMHEGLAIAIWGLGGRCGFIGFGMPHNESAFDVRNYVRLHLAAQISFNRHCNLVEEAAAGDIRLSRARRRSCTGRRGAKAIPTWPPSRGSLARPSIPTCAACSRNSGPTTAR